MKAGGRGEPVGPYILGALWPESVRWRLETTPNLYLAIFWSIGRAIAIGKIDKLQTSGPYGDRSRVRQNAGFRGPAAPARVLANAATSTAANCAIPRSGERR